MLKKISVFLILAGTLFSLYPQSFSFEHLTIEDGLSQSSINSIQQDKRGYLWLATGNGLDKYDGYNFTVYKYSPLSKVLLSSDIIYSIYEGRDGNIWIGTDEGLNVVDPVSNTVNRYVNDPGNPESISPYSIMPVIEDYKGNIWAGTIGGGLNKLNRKTGIFTRFSNNPSNLKASPYDHIFTLCEDGYGNIWNGSYAGLSKFDPVNNRFTNYAPDTKEKWSRRVVSILMYNTDNLLVAYEGGYLYLFNLKTNKFSLFPGTLTGVLKTKRISTVMVDKSGNLWIGTSGSGIVLYNPATQGIREIKNNPLDPLSLSDNTVTSIYKDRSGVVWVGTLMMGLNKLQLNRNKFALYKMNPYDKTTFSSNFIFSLYEDKEGVLWIGTTAGLNSFDRGKNKIKIYREGKSGLNDGFISALGQCGNGDILAGTRLGLNRLNRKTGAVKVYEVKPNSHSGQLENFITAIYRDREGLVWIGTNTGTFARFNENEGTFTTIEPDRKLSKEIGSIFEDRSGILWVGVNAGLFRFNKATGEFKDMKIFRGKEARPAQYVFSIAEDFNGNLWLGTAGGGLYKYDRVTNSVKQFSENDGLPNNVIYGILADSSGMLWLSTNKGICKFDPVKLTFRTFDVSDGLQGYEYNSNAFFKSPSGEMFFGGTNGFNSFYPERIKDNPAIPPVEIISVKVYGRIVNPVNGTIELPFNRNYISFDFVSLDYGNSKKNRYSYVLEGFDKTWVAPGYRRYANYTNLAPGEYVFRVKGSNSDDVWNEKGAFIKVIIYPPFWETWWFYIIAAVFTGLVVYSIHWLRLRSKIKQLLQFQEMRKKIADDFHDELGHRLTKISLYTELIKHNDEGTTEYLNKINQTAASLYDDTKDLIWSLDPVKDSLFDLAIYLKDFGDELFDKKGVGFRINEIPKELENILLPVDWKRQLILIFKEAMNNILRHSGCSNVELFVACNEGDITLRLSDDGKGFVTGIAHKGRGLKNMKSRAEKIKCSLDIVTGNKGTEIIFNGSLFAHKSVKK